jgi:hypothetical protein
MFRELPNIDAILINPLQERMPEDAAAQYAVASALARCASDSNFDRICLYLGACPRNSACCACAMRPCARLEFDTRPAIRNG